MSIAYRLADLVAATRAAKANDQFIATRVKQARFDIIRAMPRKGRSHDVTVLVADIDMTTTIERLNRYAKTGEL